MIIVSFISASAQSKLHYTASVEAGILKGSTDKKNTFLITNGVRYKSLMASIGSGIDNYFYRSIPLFLQAEKTFGNHRVQPFVRTSAGINFSHLTGEQKLSYISYDSVHFKNGFIAAASVGVSVKVFRQMRVFVSGGYSYKTTKVIYQSYYIYGPEDASHKNIDIYHLNRWCVSAGFRF